MTAEAREEAPGVHVRFSFWRLARAVGSGVLPCAVGFLLLPFVPVAPWFGVPIGLYVFAVLARQLHVVTPGTLRADADGVWLDETRLVRIADVSEAFAVGHRRAALLDFVLRGPRLRVRFVLEELADARRLLRATGLSAARRVAVFRLQPPERQSQIAMGCLIPLGIAAFAATTAYGLPVVTPLAVGVLWGLGVWRALQVRVTVGADGVRVESALRRRFVPIGDVRAAGRLEVRTRAVVQIVTAEGVIELFLGNDHARAEELVARVTEAMDLGGQAPVRAVRAVQRGGATVEAWLRALRALGAGARDDARTAPVPRADLLSVVRDSGARPVLRLAAAAALGPEAIADERAAIHAAAQACAEPGLREAMLVAVEDPLGPALERHLEALSDGA